MRKFKTLLLTTPILLVTKLTLAAEGDVWKLTGGSSTSITDITSRVNSTMKSATDSIVLIGSITSLIIGAVSLMFSSGNAMKKLINAGIGSGLAFGATMIISSIYSMFN